MKINSDTKLRVRLNKFGFEHLLFHHCVRENRPVAEYIQPQLDSDGMITYSFFDFMSIFGASLVTNNGIIRPIPFDGDIEILQDESSEEIERNSLDNRSKAIEILKALQTVDTRDRRLDSIIIFK